MLGVGWTIKQLGSKHSDHQSQPSSNCLHINHRPNLSDLVSRDAGNWIEWFGTFANSIKQVSHVWGKQIIFLIWRRGESFFVSKRRNEAVRFVSGSHWWIRHECRRFSLGEGCCIMTCWLALSSGLTLPNEKCITDCDADDAVDSQGTLPGKNGAESTVRFFVFFFEKLADLQIRKELEIWPLCSWGFTTRDFIDALRAIWVEWNSSKYGTAARTTCSWMEECKGTDNLTEFLVCVFDTLKMKVPGKVFGK